MRTDKKNRSNRSNVNKIKRVLLTAALMAVVLLSCLAGCGRMPGQSGSVEIVATVFPAYDFARALTKDVEGVSVKMLLSPGTESHTFDPSAGDAIALSECGLFVYAGGDADPWVEKFFNADKTLESRSVSMSGAVPEKLVIEGEDEDDPHVWTSPKNAVEILQTIEDRILDLPEIRADEGKAAQIRDNYDAYKAELEKLDKDFRDLAAAIPEAKRTLAFGDRYPFRYFCAEYGFTAVAVFPGCAEESEPAASDVKHVIDTIREKELDTVYYVELSNHRIADTIAAETGATTACLHSCHNLSKADFDAGETYLSLMRRNYETLKALAAVEEN